MNELDQLKQLVLENGFDDESRKQVDDLEARLKKIALAENLAENPIIQEYIAYMSDLTMRAKALLLHDRSLTDRERDKLFERIDLCERFTGLFTGKDREEIENTIKDLLHVAKNS